MGYARAGFEITGVDIDHNHKEGEPHRPSNPYSASKSAQESIIYAYRRTYGLEVAISNTMNIIGEIFHGANDHDKRVFRDICERDDINRLAVGGAYFNNVLNSMDMLIETMSTGKKYLHYHVLGVANMLQVVLLMRMAAKKFAPLISSDSSTHIQEAVAKGYHFQPHIFEQVRYINIGDKFNYPNAHQTLPCSCPVCSAIKYTDVLGVLNSNTTTFMLMMHNIFSTQRYVKAMTEIAEKATTKELKSVLKHQMKNRGSLEETLKGLDFLDVVEQHGLKAARKRYSFYVSRYMEDNKEGTLFSDGTVVTGKEEPDETDYLKLDATLKRYESESGVKHGTKTKVVTIKGHKIPKSFAKRQKSKIRKSTTKSKT